MAETREWDSSRTETAIRRITDSEVALSDLSGQRVVVEAGSLENENCQHALFAFTNLLTRLDTLIDVIAIVLPSRDVDRLVYHPGTAADAVPGSLRDIADGIASPVQVRLVDEARGLYDAAVVLGGAEGSAAPFAVRIGSDGWLAHVATKEEAVSTFSENVNPVGAYLAGCMASAEVFKHALLDAAEDSLQVNVEHVDDVKLSALDYSVNAENPPNPVLPKAVDLDHLNVVGVGAGGGALVHVLSAVDEVDGSVRLVDSDEVSESNLNRYIWAFNKDVNSMKTQVGARILGEAHPDLSVESYPVPYRDYAESVDGMELDLVVSTVDSVAAREEIQWDLPRTVLDAATNQQGFYVVSRVEFGVTQCLGCKHSQKGGKRQELEVVADKIGVTAETVYRMDKDNDAFSSEQVRSIRSQADPERDFTIPSDGERFSDWFREQCGHMDLAVADEPVPAPFLPVTAGVLLAGEVIKHRHFPSYRVDSKFTHNMFYRPRQRLHKFTGPDEACSICGGDRAVNRYQEKWEMD